MKHNRMDMKVRRETKGTHKITVQTSVCKVNHLEGERCMILVWISEETGCDMSHNVHTRNLLLPLKQTV